MDLRVINDLSELKSLYKQILTKEDQLIELKGSLKETMDLTLEFIDSCLLFISSHEKLSKKYHVEAKIWKRIYSLIETLKSNQTESLLWIQFLQLIIEKLSMTNSHYLMASIGDIYRYLMVYLNQKTSQESIHWYQKAILNCPKNGLYYYKLAIVYSLESQSILSVLYFLRSLSVKSPYLNAKDEFKMVLSGFDSELYLKLIHMIYQKINYEAFHGHYKSWKLQEMSQLSEASLILIAVHYLQSNTCVLEGIVLLAWGLLEKAIQNNHLESIFLLSLWMSHYSSMLESYQSNHLWSKVCNWLNELDLNLELNSIPTMIHGFYPLEVLLEESQTLFRSQDIIHHFNQLFKNFNEIKMENNHFECHIKQQEPMIRKKMNPSIEELPMAQPLSIENEMDEEFKELRSKQESLSQQLKITQDLQQKAPIVELIPYKTNLAFDTNWYLGRLPRIQSIYQSGQWNLVIPSAVIIELRGLQFSKPTAKAAYDWIESIKMQKQVRIVTPEGLDVSNFPMDQLEPLVGHMDNIILSTVKQCQDTVLITMDKNLRIKARAMNIPTLAFISSIE